MDNLDIAIKNSISEHFQDLKDFQDIENKVPDSDVMLKEIYKNIKRNQRKRVSILQKAAIACLILFITFPIVLFLGNTKPASALRYQIIQLFVKVENGVTHIQSNEPGESNELQASFKDYEEAKKKIPFPVKFPTFVLQGYTLKSINVDKTVDGIAVVSLKFINKQSLAYTIHMDNINNEKQESQYVKDVTTIEQMEINNQEVYCISSPTYTKLMWMDKGVYYEVSGNMSTDDAIAVVSSFQ